VRAEASAHGCVGDAVALERGAAARGGDRRRCGWSGGRNTRGEARRGGAERRRAKAAAAGASSGAAAGAGAVENESGRTR
jgi:hypothetical protein